MGTRLEEWISNKIVGDLLKPKETWVFLLFIFFYRTLYGVTTTQTKEKQMEKIFKFHAKQGQESMVCRLLTEIFGKPKAEKTAEGVMITLKLPKKVSKRTVDRLLHANNVPGSHARKNKYQIIRHSWESHKLKNQIDDFFVTGSGKFVKYEWIHPGCECCGSYIQRKRS